MAEQSAQADARVAAIAGRQHGVVSIAQLREAGLSDDQVLGRTRAGRLHRLHRGVYAVGHPNVTLDGRWMAAVLAIGDAAVLSHRSAAALWGLLKPSGGPVDVSIAARAGRRKRQGIRLRRRTDLPPEQRTRRRGIPVTTSARTITDPRSMASPEEYRRAIRQAEVRGLPTGLAVRPAPTRSELEDRFLALCRHHRLPEPEVNVRIGAVTVDFLWRERRLVVETDGYRYHRGETAFEQDHARDLRLRALGYDVMRLSFWQVTRDPEAVAALISRELAGGGRPREPDRREA